MTGTGTLTSNAAYDVRGGRVDANLAGSGIGLTKSGSTLAVLTGANTYTGRTTVNGGMLEFGPGAQSCVLNVGGADIQSGMMVFDYAGSSDPMATIAGLLTASYDGGHWDVGQFRDSTALATGLTLGLLDDTTLDQVKVMATYPGDFNLDGVVDGQDMAIWFANAFSGTTWQQGDANHDGVVDGLDRDLLFSHVGLSPLPGMSSAVESRVGARAGHARPLSRRPVGTVGLRLEETKIVSVSARVEGCLVWGGMSCVGVIWLRCGRFGSSN